MPRKLASDTYKNFLDPASAKMSSSSEDLSIKGKKRPGRPKKENIASYSPFLGKLMATGKITKNNLTKDYSLDLTPKKTEYKPEFVKDDEYDYGEAYKRESNKADEIEQQKIISLSGNKLDNYLQNSGNGIFDLNQATKALDYEQYQPLQKGEKDALGFGIANRQMFTGNPFDLDFGKILSEQKTDSIIEVPKTSFSKEQLDRLGNLKVVRSDILSGNTEALKDPSFKTLGLNNVKLAIEWLLNNQGLTNSGMAGLLKEPWRLVYRAKPPTMTEFLTEKYIGPDAQTLFPWVRDTLIQGFDPTTPLRNIILYYFIGGGKSKTSVLSNLYVSLCNSLMWHQYKYYGHAQPLSSVIQTPSGPQRMGDLKVGDIVINPNGGESIIQEIRPQGLCQCFEIELEDGRKAKFNKHHLFKATWQQDKEGNDIWEILELQEIMKHPERDWYLPDFENF